MMTDGGYRGHPACPDKALLGARRAGGETQRSHYHGGNGVPPNPARLSKTRRGLKKVKEKEAVGGER